MANPTITGPQLTRINKKTGANAFTLYHPQTGAEMVLYDGSLGLPWTTSTKPSDVHKYTSQGIQDDTSGTYYLLSDVLKYINVAIDDFGGVLEFKGSSTPAALGSMSDLSKGEVWIVSNDSASADSVYWTDNFGGSTVTWQQFPNNTLFVYTGEMTKAISDVGTGSGTSVTRGWVPLGGNNNIYALKTEAIHSIIGDSSGLKIGYASESTTTHPVSGVGTIGTASVGTTAITTSISSGSSTAIPTEGAVYNFAANAGKLTTQDAQYPVYMIGVTETQSGAGQEPIHTGIEITWAEGAVRPSINADAIYSQWAGTASQVGNGLTIGGITFNGAAGRTVTIGNGLNAAVNAGADTATITVKTVSTGSGIYVSGDGVKIQLVSNNGVNASGLSVSQNGLKVNPAASGAVVIDANGAVDLAKPNTITTDAVYSAIQVDAYGRAKAGAQSIVWANSLSQGELADLVIGGLAMISSNETQQSDKASSTNNLTVDN